eukprot:6203106-Pleurochrysis_carterae.AAC.1
MSGVSDHMPAPQRKASEAQCLQSKHGSKSREGGTTRGNGADDLELKELMMAVWEWCSVQHSRVVQSGCSDWKQTALAWHWHHVQPGWQQTMHGE